MVSVLSQPGEMFIGKPIHSLNNKGHPSLTIRQDSVVRLYYIYKEVNGT